MKGVRKYCGLNTVLMCAFTGDPQQGSACDRLNRGNGQYGLIGITLYDN